MFINLNKVIRRQARRIPPVFYNYLWYYYNSPNSLSFLTISAPPCLCLDELVPVELLVQLSERFAAVALDTVLGHQLFERRSDLRERHCRMEFRRTGFRKTAEKITRKNGPVAPTCPYFCLCPCRSLYSPRIRRALSSAALMFGQMLSGPSSS